MKERIVITQDWLVKDMKAGVVENDKLFICQKVEQLPESWEDLQELCKDLIDVDMTENAIFLVGINFRKNGEVFDNDSITIAENRTPEQMWQIIKSLTKQEDK